jgi:hypothetical protein
MIKTILKIQIILALQIRKIFGLEVANAAHSNDNDIALTISANQQKNRRLFCALHSKV